MATTTTPAWSTKCPAGTALHGSAGGDSAAAIAHYFQTNDPPTSTHYIIGRDGAIVQCVRESDTAWGNGVLSAGHAPWWPASVNPNQLTFSIEHVKPHSDNSDLLTPAQSAASFALVRHLCARWHIPARPADAQGGITGHFSIDPVNRARCPGAYPWDDLWTHLKGTPTMTFVKQPDGSARDDTTGVVLHFGMAAYVLDHSVAQHALLAETYYTPTDSFVPCDGGLVLTYNKQENRVRADRAGETLLAIWNVLSAANVHTRELDDQIAALQAQLTQARQQQPAQPSASDAATAAIRALAAALAGLPAQ